MAIKWTQALAVGHPTIDGQHQELFRRLDKLLEAMMKGDRDEIGRLFDFLASYVVEHFGTEEKLMRDAGYAGYEMHKLAHERFVKDYLAFRKSYEDAGGGAALTIKLQNWVGDWLKAHIAGTDQVLAKALVKRAG